jgi:hypothetical protein
VDYRPKHVALFKINDLRICTKCSYFVVLVQMYIYKCDAGGTNVSHGTRKKRADDTTWYTVGTLTNCTVSWRVNVFLITESSNYIRQKRSRVLKFLPQAQSWVPNCRTLHLLLAPTHATRLVQFIFNHLMWRIHIVQFIRMLLHGSFC